MTNPYDENALPLVSVCFANKRMAETAQDEYLLLPNHHAELHYKDTKHIQKQVKPVHGLRPKDGSRR